MKYLLIIFLLILISPIVAQNLTFKLDTSTAFYFTEYNDYEWDEPLTGLLLNAELYNLSGRFGLGASGFYSFSSADDNFDFIQIYDGYIHYFTALINEKKYFIHGFYGGIRYAMIDYTPYKTDNLLEENFLRPLVGFKFANELWGFDINWSQADDRKPILGYELKFRSSSNWIMKIGRRNRGFISDVDSDVFFNLGYEFYG